MNVSYFGYFVEDVETTQRYLFDIRPLLAAYSKTTITFQSKFVRKDDHLFLLPCTRNMYQFIITRDDEVIKKIQRSNLNVSNILLENGEQIGFTSYIYFDNGFLGFASTIKAPKSPAFTNFVNDIFKRIKIRKYNFVLKAIMQNSIKQEIMQMPFIGKSSIIIGKENTLFEDFMNKIKFSHENIVDIESLEIIIKPKRNKNIADAMKVIIDRVGNSDVSKFVLKAKHDLDDSLADFYLVGQGQISDALHQTDEHELDDEIQKRIGNNELLQDKIEAFKDGPFKKKIPEALVPFTDVSAWPCDVGGV